MALISDETIRLWKPALVVLGSVFVFNSLPKFNIIGEYFNKYPILIFAVGVAIIIWATKR